MTAVEIWIGYAPWLAVMGALLAASAFFSASEAALFYLSRPERLRLARGNRGSGWPWPCWPTPTGC
jgi:hypothetical protein